MTTPKRLKRKGKFKLAILSPHIIQYFSPLYRRLALEKNIDLTVIYYSRQGLDKYYDKEMGVTLQWDIPLLDGYKYKFLPDIWGNIPSTYSPKRVQPTIFREVIRGDYDALWIYSYKSPTYQLAILAAKISKTPLLFRTDSHLKLARLQRRTFRNLMRIPLLKFVFSLFDSALAIGTNNAEYYRAYGMLGSKIFMVPYTVDNELFTSCNKWDVSKIRQVKRELAIPLDIPVILFVGKLIPNKEPLILLTAFHQMQRKLDKPATLIFVGDGELRAELEHYCLDNDVKNVTFAGFVNQSNIVKYYALADIFALLSIEEAWGLVVNEAMCAKNAVLVSDSVGAASDLVLPGENGFIFPVGDVDALSQHLTTLVSDPVLCKQMGQRSLDIISHWSLDDTVNGTKQALLQVNRE